MATDGSRKSIEAGQCGECGLSADFTAWRIVDAANESLKAALVDESLFLWTCPHCGYRCRAYYELVYDDGGRDFRLLLTGDEGRDALGVLAAALPPRKIGRSVADGDALREKIRMLEDGVDDRAMEAYKLFLRRYIDTADRFSYQGRDENGFLFRRLAAGMDAEEESSAEGEESDQATGKLIVASAAVYEDMRGDIEGIPLPDGAYPCVDESWAEKYLDG